MGERRIVIVRGVERENVRVLAVLRLDITLEFQVLIDVVFVVK